MKARKITGLVLSASLVASMAAAAPISVSAASMKKNSDFDGKIGIVGSMTGWGKVSDVPMTDADGDGVYEGTFKITVTENMLIGDEIQFKIRGFNDSGWSNTWGVYEADFDRTYNSQTNCAIKARVGDVIIEKVTLDTTRITDMTPYTPAEGKTFEYWPVSYETVTAAEDSDDVKAAKRQLGDDLSKYYFFDNSYTKYETVGAYSWTPSEVYGGWPGSAISRIEGTDIWYTVVNEDMDRLIFNNQVTDAEYSVEKPKCYTEVIQVNERENNGQIFTPDSDTEEVMEDGAVKKIDGSWKKLAPIDVYEVILTEDEPAPEADSIINSNEQIILNALREGMYIGNNYTNLPADYVNQAENYFRTVSVTSEQATQITGKINEAKSYIRDLNNTGIRSFYSLSADQIANLVRIANEAASVMGVTLAFDASEFAVSAYSEDGSLISTVKFDSPAYGFRYCDGTYYSSKNNKYISGVVITGCSDPKGDIVIPEKIGGKTVIGFNNNAFQNCNELTSVTMPDTVLVIDAGTFSHCTGLKSIAIPDSVEIIGSTVFSDCTSLSDVKLPESITSIYGSVFNGCTGLTSITIPESVTDIGIYAFYGCTGLKDITIPDSVTNIGELAFVNCTGLTSVTIGNNVANIGYEAFSHCTGLTSITIPDSVTSIGELAFVDCTGLTDVSIGNSVTSVDDWAFYGCTGLTSITIPDSVTNIGEMASGYYYDFDNDEERKIAGFKIYGKTGSAAETYANENGFRFIDLNHEHIPGEATHENEKPATCTEPGSYDEVVKCTVCDEEISRDTKTIPATGHTPGAATRENEKSATCTETGNYDEVVKCTVCGEEISRETETIPATGHNWGEWAADGDKEVRTCKNDATHKETRDIEVSSVKLDKTSITLEAGKTQKLTATITPSNAANKTLTWTTSNKSIATVSNGTVKAVKAGTATITVKSANGKKATCKVTVKAAAVNATKVKLNRTILKLNKGKTSTLKATITPSNTTNKKLTWTTSNKKVATVDSKGKVKAVGKGTATITVKTANGKKATCKVTVKIPATKVKLNKTKASIKVGKTLTLKAAMTPSKSIDKLTWKTSNKKVATVKNGKITAKKAGTAIITVRTSSGKTAKCKITVKKK